MAVAPLAGSRKNNKIESPVFHKYLPSVRCECIDSSAPIGCTCKQHTYVGTCKLDVFRLQFSLSMQLACTNASLLVRATDKGSSVIYTLHSSLQIYNLQISSLQIPSFQILFYKYCFPNFGFQFSVYKFGFQFSKVTEHYRQDTKKITVNVTEPHTSYGTTDNITDKL